MAASGGTQQFLIKRQSALATLATGNFQTFRATRGQVRPAKRTVQSEIIRSDRETDANTRVFSASEGALQSELLAADPGHNELMARALFSSFTHTDLADVSKGRTVATVTIASGTVATAGNTLTRASGDFIAEGLVDGVWIGLLDGVNDGWWKVLDVTSATVLTLAVPGISFTGAVIADLANTSAVSTKYNAAWIRNSVLRAGLSVERGFTDVSQFLHGIGLIPNTMTIGMRAGQIATIQAQMLGVGFGSGGATVGGTPVAAGTSSPVSGATNVARLHKNGAVLPVGVRSQEIIINDNLSQLEQLGSITAADVIAGKTGLTGRIEAYFADRTVFHDLVVGHADFAYETAVVDDQGNLLAITLPRCNILSGGVDEAGHSDPVVEAYEIGAVRDATLGYGIQIASITKPV
jgi:hypothetical protein